MTKVQISLKRMMKTLEGGDQGFLVECRALQGVESLEAFYGVDEIFNLVEALTEVLSKYDDVL